MSFSESLTVRILGDSSQLQRELDIVLDQFDELKSRISESTNSARRLSSSFSRLSQAIGPLQQVSKLIARIGLQLQSISSRPISLNVGPALQSLQQLSQAAQQAAAAIHAIPPMPAVGPAPFPFPFPFPGGRRVPNQQPRRMAGGGLVSGPSGIDRVSAKLTAGEYVINRSAVETLGLGFLDSINSMNQSGSDRSPSLSTHQPPEGVFDGKRTRLPVPSLQPPSRKNSPDGGRHSTHLMSQEISRDFSQSSTTNNHFGGITIQVSDQADTESLIRDLELQGIGRRIRQG